MDACVGNNKNVVADFKNYIRHWLHEIYIMISDVGNYEESFKRSNKCSSIINIEMFLA